MYIESLPSTYISDRGVLWCARYCAHVVTIAVYFVILVLESLMSRQGSSLLVSSDLSDSDLSDDEVTSDSSSEER